jgi:hypothetical protein
MHSSRASSQENPPWVDLLLKEALAEAQRIKESQGAFDDLSRYHDDPVGFGTDILRESYTDDIRDVMLSVRDNPITIARSANAVGKSHGAARIAMWWFATRPEAKVYVTAAPPLENLKRILWGEIASIVDKKPELFVRYRTKSLKIVRNSQSFIDGVAIPTSGTSEEREAKFSGKHAPYLLFIVDEGDAVPDEVYKGIESCMSGGVARLLVMFNPRAQAGPVYLKERDHQANVVRLTAIDHPNVTSGSIVIPGAVTREVVVRRINEWTRPAAANEAIDQNFWLVPDYLVGATAVGLDGNTYPPLEAGYRRVNEPSFFYMVLGDYPPQGVAQLISQVWIDAARARWDLYVAAHGETPPAGVQPIIGIDIAELGTDSNVCCPRYGGFVARLKSWSSVDADMSATRALESYRALNAQIAFIDGTGVGASVAPSMVRQSRGSDNVVRAIGVKVSEKPGIFIKSELGEFRTMRDQLWWAVREWLRTDSGAMLPPDPMLLEELRVPTYDVPGGKIEVMPKQQMRQLLRRSPDRADALCLTFAPIAKPTFTLLNVSAAGEEAARRESAIRERLEKIAREHNAGAQEILSRRR